MELNVQNIQSNKQKQPKLRSLSSLGFSEQYCQQSDNYSFRFFPCYHL